MSVLIAAARNDENNNIGGGKKGDQTGHEVESYAWTDRSGDGWNVLRYKNPDIRSRAVEMAKQIVNNPLIGYSQWTHGSLERAGREVNWDFSAINSPVDTDCCDMQRTIAIANGIKVGSCYTATQVKTFMATNQFELLTGAKYAHTDRYLIAGDVGCMPPGVQGHTWIAIEDGDLAGNFSETTYVVNCNSLRQRSAPSLDSETIQYLPRNAAFNVVSYVENKEEDILWAQGEYEGIYGYCSMKYLVPAVELPILTTIKPTWLRSEPIVNLQSRIVVIPQGQTFHGTGRKFLDKDSRVWYEVIYNTIRGWVSYKYLSIK